MPDLDDLKSSPLAGLILGAALSRMAEGRGEPKSTRPVGLDVAALEAAADRYSAPVPFSPRQLVTPRADSPVKGAGRPHVVLETDPGAVALRPPLSPSELSSSGYGRRLDMRVAATCECDHGEINAYWVESWMFEPWTPPADAAADPTEPAAI